MNPQRSFKPLLDPLFRLYRISFWFYQPDYVIIVDPTLLRGTNCFSGLKDNGIAIISDRQGLEIPKVKASQKVFVLPANDIALKTIGRPLGNTALLGGFCAATGELELNILVEAVKNRFSGKAQEGNIQAVREGFEFVKNKL